MTSSRASSKRKPREKRYGLPVTELERQFLEALVNGVPSSVPMVTPETSIQVTTVFACVRVIADAVSTLPFFIYRRLADGGKERAEDHPLFRLVHDEPNQLHTSDVFRSMLMAHVLLYGNAFAQVLRNQKYQITGLLPIHPSRVKVAINKTTGAVAYSVKEDNNTERLFMRDEMIHLRWITTDGVLGYTPVALLRAAIELSMSAEQHGLNVFKRGGALKGVLEYPTELTQDAFERLVKTWRDQTEGTAKAWATPILEAGLKFTPLGQVNTDAQFLESRRFQVEEIVRFYGVPKHKVMDTERATYSNISQEDLSFYKDTVRPWLTRLQNEFNRTLFAFDREYFVEFLIDDLLRAETKTRFEVYGIAIEKGIMTRNEVRARENLNPVEGGDEILLPLNMAKPGELPPAAEPQQKEDDEQIPRAMTELISDTLKRISQKETLMLQRYWGKDGFVKRVEEFYLDYEAFVLHHVRTALTAAARVLHDNEPAGIEGYLASFCSRFVGERKEKVLWYLEDGEPNELLSEIERENIKWSGQAIKEVQALCY